MQNAPVPGDEEPGPPPGDAARAEAAGAAPQPGAAPEAIQATQATQATTVALIVALVVVVVMTGVLGAVAILMTRNPDAPPLSETPVRRLQTPMHFAPVTGVRAGPCTSTDAVPDDTGSTCYQLDPAVTVTTVQKIEPIPERDGSYSIRLVLSPADQDEIAKLTRETVKQQLAIVVGEKVVAAPRVAQEITQDSLSIAGFTKDRAAALIALLTGSAAVPGGQPTGPSPTASTPTGPATGASSPADAGTLGGLDSGGTTQPGTTQPGAAGTGAARPTPGQAVQSAGRRTAGTQRFATCKEANAHGYGPYTKGVHPEYYWYRDVDRDGVACDPGDLA